jgi:hypothetical protein
VAHKPAASVDRSTVYIAFCDLLFAVLAVVVVAYAPAKAKPDIQEQALYMLSIEWDTQLDIDPDIWLVPPAPSKPVFFGNRQMGCISLDQDNRGWLDDGVGPDGKRVARAREMITMRCIKPGHYDLGVNLYGYSAHQSSDPTDGSVGLAAHVRIEGLNPSKTLFESDVKLNRIGQTINAASFELDPDGTMKFVAPPLAPVTDSRVTR